MANNEKHYNKIIGITKQGEVAVLEYTFEDSEDLKGATGYRMGILTQSQIDERKSFEYADEYMWKDAVQNGRTELGFEEWWEELVEESEIDGYLFPYDDDSFRCKTEELYGELEDTVRYKIEEILGVKGEDYVTFDCSSCGRCFDEDTEWDLVIEPELIEEIKKLEHKETTVCTECGKAIGYKTNENIYHHDGKKVCHECDEKLTKQETEVKEKEITMKVVGYLMNLPKQQVVEMILQKVSSYQLKDVVEQATGDKSNWMYVNKDTMNSEVQV